MHDSMITLLMNDSARAVLLQYEEGGKATIGKTLDPDLKVGDMVVVQSDTRWNLTVAKVTEVDVDVNFDDGQARAQWVLSIIDVELRDKLLAWDAKAIQTMHAAEKRRKREEMRAKLFADQSVNFDELALAAPIQGGSVIEPPEAPDFVDTIEGSATE